MIKKMFEDKKSLLRVQLLELLDERNAELRKHQEKWNKITEELTSQCTHTWDDGESAWQENHDRMWCAICHSRKENPNYLK